MRREEGKPHPVTAALAPRYHRVPLFSLTNAVVINAKLLGNEVDDASLEGGERAREGELVAHTVLFENEDTRVDV